MKHNKSNTALLHEIVIFSRIYLSEAIYMISSINNLMAELQELIPNAIIIL